MNGKIWLFQEIYVKLCTSLAGCGTRQERAAVRLHVASAIRAVFPASSPRARLDHSLCSTNNSLTGARLREHAQRPCLIGTLSLLRPGPQPSAAFSTGPLSPHGLESLSCVPSYDTLHDRIHRPSVTARLPYGKTLGFSKLMLQLQLSASAFAIELHFEYLPALQQLLRSSVLSYTEDMMKKARLPKHAPLRQKSG